MDEVNVRQAEILTQLATVIKLSEEGRNEIKLLRVELGLGDSVHGRIPVVESRLGRLEQLLDKMNEEIDKLQHTASESVGKNKLVTSVIAILSGGGVVGLIELAKTMLK